MGAWIEISERLFYAESEESLPLWERGLKFFIPRSLRRLRRVAPLVGAWIEIGGYPVRRRRCPVAPLVGAWIEIRCIFAVKLSILSSLPLWERGLKSTHTNISITLVSVAPLVGAWIEISRVA